MNMNICKTGKNIFIIKIKRNNAFAIGKAAVNGNNYIVFYKDICLSKLTVNVYISVFQ